MADTYSLADVRSMDGAGDVFTLAAVQKMAEGPSFTDQMLKRETSDLSANLRRGVKDVIDTGAEGLAYAWDKLTGADPAQGEYARVKSMNEAGRSEWQKANEGLILPHLQRIGGNALGTAPLTTALGAGVGAAGLPRLGNAISSAGMTTGGSAGRLADMATRMAGGGINGYVSAGMVEPNAAATGGFIGAVTPPALQGAHAVVKRAADALNNRGTAGLAREIAELGGANPSNLEDLARMRDVLRQQGPSLIPGAEPTVPQILQTPGLSQLQRSVKAVNPGALGARESEQAVARMEALNRIAPVSGTVQQAADEVGNSIARYALPAEAQARKKVSALFDAIPPDEARMQLPLTEMEAARAKFLGPGTFGKGASAADAAVEEATAIGTRRAPGLQLDYSSSDLSRLKPVGGHAHGIAGGELARQAVPFDQLQKLRSSINEAIAQAGMRGQAQAKAALVSMKNAIDNKVADVAAGNALPGEVFTPQAIDTWGQALRTHADKKLQFNTGPQASMFRVGGDGMPQIQGAEIPSKFFSSSRSQVENAQAFRRLVADDPRLMGDLQRYAITDAAGQVDRFGNLTNAKFNRWLDARSGATGEIFSEQQRAILKAVAEDLRRADMAENLGRSTGSDTAQKAANMIRLGLVDHPAAGWAASYIPGGQTVLGMLRRPFANARAERIGGLLADPERVGGLLDTLITRQAQPQGLLGMAADPAMHRAFPLLYSQGAGGGGN